MAYHCRRSTTIFISTVRFARRNWPCNVILRFSSHSLLLLLNFLAVSLRIAERKEKINKQKTLYSIYIYTHKTYTYWYIWNWFCFGSARLWTSCLTYLILKEIHVRSQNTRFKNKNLKILIRFSEIYLPMIFLVVFSPYSNANVDLRYIFKKWTKKNKLKKYSLYWYVI